MAASVQNPEKNKFYAGLCLRTRNRTRFWGWGQPAFNEVRPVDRPWAGLADWLRLAHSTIFMQPSSPTSEEKHAVKTVDSTPSPARLALSSAAHSKRRIRFVCGRSYIGFVIR